MLISRRICHAEKPGHSVKGLVKFGIPLIFTAKLIRRWNSAWSSLIFRRLNSAEIPWKALKISEHFACLLTKPFHGGFSRGANRFQNKVIRRKFRGIPWKALENFGMSLACYLPKLKFCEVFFYIRMPQTANNCSHSAIYLNRRCKETRKAAVVPKVVRASTERRRSPVVSYLFFPYSYPLPPEKKNSSP